MSAIEIKNLTKAYKDVTAVKNLSLTIEDGELFALLGVNGAGKSTLIRCLTCITEATSGEALVGGHSITNEAPLVKEKIAVSPQSTAIANNAPPHKSETHATIAASLFRTTPHLPNHKAIVESIDIKIKT